MKKIIPIPENPELRVPLVGTSHTGHLAPGSPGRDRPGWLCTARFRSALWVQVGGHRVGFPRQERQETTAGLGASSFEKSRAWTGPRRTAPIRCRQWSWPEREAPPGPFSRSARPIGSASCTGRPGQGPKKGSLPATPSMAKRWERCWTPWNSGREPRRLYRGHGPGLCQRNQPEPGSGSAPRLPGSS